MFGFEFTSHRTRSSQFDINLDTRANDFACKVATALINDPHLPNCLPAIEGMTTPTAAFVSMWGDTISFVYTSTANPTLAVNFEIQLAARSKRISTSVYPGVITSEGRFEVTYPRSLSIIDTTLDTSPADLTHGQHLHVAEYTYCMLAMLGDRSHNVCREVARVAAALPEIAA